MPPKRVRAQATSPSTSKRTASAKAGTKKRRASAAKSKRTRRGSDDEGAEDDEEDSEKEIETVKDYEDAVRRRMLNSTTARYDDALEQDHLAFAASLMMPPSELQLTAEEGFPVEQQQQQWQRPHRKAVYSLGTYCMYAIVKDFKHLASDSVAAAPTVSTGKAAQRQCQTSRHSGLEFRKQVQQLPFYLSAKLFKFLKHASPELLSGKIWTSLFFPAHGEAGGGTAANGASRSVSYITELDLEGLIASEVTDTVLRIHILRTLDLGPQLERINLNGMDTLTDNTLASLVGACPVLARLSLKGCTKAGDRLLENLPAETLHELNISFVAAPTTKGIKGMVERCRELRVLKMAGVVNVKDSVFLELEKESGPETNDVATVGATTGTANASSDRGHGESGVPVSTLPLYALENLKISSTKLGDRGFKVLLRLCGRTLRRLDISATNVTRMAPIAQFCVWEDEREGSAEGESGLKARTSRGSKTCLEKLNITRLKIVSPTDLLALFKKLPLHSFHTLLMGYLTCGQVPVRDELLQELCQYLEPEKTVIDNSEDTDLDGKHDITMALPMPPPSLYSDPFAPPPLQVEHQEFHLHTLSLFGNSQIGYSRRQDFGLHLLLQRLAPFLRRLELGYTLAKASILEGLLEPQGSEAELNLPGEVRLVDNFVLEELGLDETPIGDEVSVVLSRFRRLNRLALSNTRIGKEAVEMVVRACPMLTSLDLKSCRGIPLLHRRTLLKEVRKEVQKEAAAAAAAAGQRY